MNEPGNALLAAASISSYLEMADEDDEIPSHLADSGPSYSSMDEAFCTRMCAAIAAGLENAPIGIVTTPGTKTPKYLAPEPRPLVSSQRDMEHA